MRKEFSETRKTAQKSQGTAFQALTIEVQISQSREDCWAYAWDRNQGLLRLSGFHPGQADLPADRAILRLEEQAEVPVYVLATHSIAPNTLVPARVLGALHAPQAARSDPRSFPLAGWILLASPDLPSYDTTNHTLEDLSPAVLAALRAHASASLLLSSAAPGDLRLRPAEEVASALREARFWLKQARRQAAPGQRQTGSGDEAAVAWRAVEELSAEQRAQIAQAKTLEELSALVQAVQLIRFVPARFQQALEHLLLENERLLAFLERPLLRHRTGWLGWQQYRANAGLLLLTDRQVLWVRDFFSPGATAFPEGYIARSVPLERLVSVRLLAPGETQTLVAPASPSPYLRLCLECEGSQGREMLEVAFPDDERSNQALSRMVGMLRAFLPWPLSPSPSRAADAPLQEDRRLRCLPVVRPWIPQGAQARRLQGLGGFLPGEIKQRLEQHLADTLRASNDELLASALVPALEQYRSPARLVALTRGALLLIDAGEKGWGSVASGAREPQIRRYELARITSAQLSYSLLGSDLRISVPEAADAGQQCLVPFQSPAIAWFLPLFTRLRLALSAPLPLALRSQ